MARPKLLNKMNLVVLAVCIVVGVILHNVAIGAAVGIALAIALPRLISHFTKS